MMCTLYLSVRIGLCFIAVLYYITVSPITLIQGIHINSVLMCVLIKKYLSAD